MQECRCAKVQMCNVQMCNCAEVQMCKCADVQMFISANVQMCKCAEVQMCRSADVQMCRLVLTKGYLPTYTTQLVHFEKLRPRVCSSGHIFCKLLATFFWPHFWRYRLFEVWPEKRGQKFSENVARVPPITTRRLTKMAACLCNYTEFHSQRNFIFSSLLFKLANYLKTFVSNQHHID